MQNKDFTGFAFFRERLAELAHNQWSGWMDYLFDNGVFNADGTWTMPQWAVDRWKRQAEAPYLDLSEDEQESDRKEADKFIKIFEEYIAGETSERGDNENTKINKDRWTCLQGEVSLYI